MSRSYIRRVKHFHGKPYVYEVIINGQNVGGYHHSKTNAKEQLAAYRRVQIKRRRRARGR